MEELNKVLHTMNKNIKALQSHEKHNKDRQASYNIKKQTSLESMRIIVDETQLEFYLRILETLILSKVLNMLCHKAWIMNLYLYDEFLVFGRFYLANILDMEVAYKLFSNGHTT